MKDSLMGIIEFINLKDNFIELSKKKKIIVVLLCAMFISTLIYTIFTFTDIVSKISGLEIYKTFENNLRNTPGFFTIFLGGLFLLIVYILFYSRKDALPLKEIDIEPLKKPDVSSNVFEITLANESSKNVILKELRVSWKYDPGNACSIGESTTIKSVGKYIIEIPLDTNNNNIQTMIIKMKPMIIVPSKNKSGPGIVQFTVQFHYHFSGEIDYHPNYDWEIVYSLDLIDDRNRTYNIFYGYRWRCEDELEALGDGLMDQYNQKLNANYK